MYIVTVPTHSPRVYTKLEKAKRFIQNNGHIKGVRIFAVSSKALSSGEPCSEITDRFKSVDKFNIFSEISTQKENTNATK